ncbi:CYFA0S06e02696g1_1 [Cyberlindnera fabianii]|uniref:CYFA0S06e02696g1_1 n=1 Tax=Cyberlindnera fabianii TaxID=36022 RepID=A0A061AVE1_CYBFA|nr:CYFA0S06e02696g1_1 [Cyberlindnera fabianii]
MQVVETANKSIIKSLEKRNKMLARFEKTEDYQLTAMRTHRVSRHFHMLPFFDSSNTHLTVPRSTDSTLSIIEGILLAKFSTESDEDLLPLQLPDNSFLTLTDRSIFLSIDSGGFYKGIPSDVGIVIYDTSDLIQVHINIINMPYSSDPCQLTTPPVFLTLDQAQNFLNKIFRLYLEHKTLNSYNVCLVGHNIGNDLKALALLGVHIPDHIPILNTDIIAKSLFGKELSLESVINRLGIKRRFCFHPSVNDALYTLYAFFQLIQRPQVYTSFVEGESRKWLINSSKGYLTASQSKSLSKLSSSFAMASSEPTKSTATYRWSPGHRAADKRTASIVEWTVSEQGESPETRLSKIIKIREVEEN